MSTIDDKLKERIVHELMHIRNQCVEPLATCLDYVTFVVLFALLCRRSPASRYSFLIDNVNLLITGTLHDRDVHEVPSPPFFAVLTLTALQLVSK